MMRDKLASRIYRFHSPADDLSHLQPLLLRKRKRREVPTSHLIAADETTITDVNGTRPIEAFQELPRLSFLTLTRREADLIALANPGSRPPSALEDLHPWLPKRSFVPVSTIGYQALTDLCRRYGQHLVSAAAYCDEKWNTICNSVRRKSALDARFYFAWHLPIQDVFVLEERRSDRSIVALDVNAMYSACMQQDCPEPSALRHVIIDRKHRAGDRLASGLYRCRLEGPRTDFIRKHCPFRTFYCGRRLGASLADAIEVDLNEFEISYFERHFKHIHLVDAVIAANTVMHPLAREARRAFARRQNFRTQGNKPLADREKYLATLLSSCGSRPKRFECTFPDRSTAMEYLSTSYGITPPTDEPEIATDAWLRRNKGVLMAVNSSSTRIEAPNLEDRAACFMLGQRIVAKGRIHLLELMERVLTLGPGLEICYVNIDSVHFSIPRTQLDAALAKLRREASDAMGSFKIEAVTSHGLWLEPGRYWLYSDKVEKFRNRSIGDMARPFADRAFHVRSMRIGDLHIPVRASIRMARSMSDVRELDDKSGDGLVRQRLIERHPAATFEETLDRLERSRKTATSRRFGAFAELKGRLERPCPAASGQG